MNNSKNYFSKSQIKTKKKPKSIDLGFSNFLTLESKLSDFYQVRPPCGLPIIQGSWGCAAGCLKLPRM